MNPAAVSIDVISDVVCPWCYLGRSRLAEAQEKETDITTLVQWRPFRLDPTIPPGGIPREDYLNRKFGSVQAIQPMYDQLTELGAAEGIDFRFDLITRSPNTVDAHRVIRWAADDHWQDAVVEGLFAAYFCRGLDIGDHGVLCEVAEDAGGDGQAIAARLATDEDTAAVEAEVENAYRIGVSGVPCFILAGRMVVTGAQPAETLAEAIEAAAAAPAPPAPERPH
ncbi:DsbA family oxidoreductase [Bauldia sp.]|uniref:DsbA family oxidoreductase n=1 Tax=Bauldia sp. TaxID=2575872 RepID=UPI003BAC1E80